MKKLRMGLTLSFGLCIAALTFSCSDNTTSSCKEGALSCSCTADGLCNNGLTCTGNVCKTAQVASDTTDSDATTTDTNGTPDTSTPPADTKTPPLSTGTPAPTVLTCQYPKGANMGIAIGEQAPKTMVWQGFPRGSAVEGTVKISDYLDCDAAKGYDVLLFDTSQFG